MHDERATPPDRDATDETRRSYDQFAEAFTQRYFQTRGLDEEMDRFLDLLPEKPMILDAGSGPAHQARYFGAQGAEAVGMDLSFPMLLEGRLREPSLWVAQGDLLAEPFSDSVFDGIWARASLIHLPPSDHRRSLEEFRRILKPKGWLYAAVRQGRGEEVRHETQCGVTLSRYFRFWEPDEWHDLLRATGFRLHEYGVEPGDPEDWLWVHSQRNDS